MLMVYIFCVLRASASGLFCENNVLRRIFFFLLLLTCVSPPADRGVSLQQLMGDPPPSGVVTSGGDSTTYLLDPAVGGIVAGRPALAHLPNPLYRHFSLVVRVRPSSIAPAVLFAITDGPQRLLHVALKLGPATPGGGRPLLLFYTEPDAEASYLAARFHLPGLAVGAWNRFSLAVGEDLVSLYLGCDAEPQVVPLERSPDPLELDPGATIFVGQAGAADKDRFHVGFILKYSLPAFVQLDF